MIADRPIFSERGGNMDWRYYEGGGDGRQNSGVLLESHLEGSRVVSKDGSQDHKKCLKTAKTMSMDKLLVSIFLELGKHVLAHISNAGGPFPQLWVKH